MRAASYSTGARLTCDAGSGLKPGKPVLDDFVTFTGRSFHFGTILYLYRPPAVRDEAIPLHRLSDKRYRTAVRPHDLRQKVMGVGQLVPSCAIMHHQEPPAHPLFDRMQGIASGCLRELRNDRLRVVKKKTLDLRVALEDGVQLSRVAAKHWPRQLHQASDAGWPTLHCRKYAKRAFVPDIGTFDLAAVFHDGQ